MYSWCGNKVINKRNSDAKDVNILVKCIGIIAKKEIGTSYCEMSIESFVI